MSDPLSVLLFLKGRGLCCDEEAKSELGQTTRTVSAIASDANLNFVSVMWSEAAATLRWETENSTTRLL